MIVSFSDAAAEAFYVSGKRPRTGWQSAAPVVARKLDYLHAARKLEDLARPPGNRLEALRGDRIGQHRIWVNDQWSICFVWTELGPASVELTDYH